jgi:TolB-like protein
MSGNEPEIDLKSAVSFQIGEYTFSVESRELRSKSGDLVALRRQSSDVLALLCLSAGQVVPRETLVEKVWPDTFVTDDSLMQCIADIRRALGDGEHKLVQTVPKRGYLLMAAPVADAVASPSVAPRGRPSRTHTDLALGAVLAIALVALFWPRAADGPPHDGVPTIAVLPFDDFSAGDDKGYLSDAIAEGVITELARSRLFRVIARNSSFRYRDTDTGIRQIGAELGADYVLEGSKQKNGDRLRVTVQLIDAASEEHLWAHTYDQPIGDLFIVQDRIIRTVADRVGDRIERPLPVNDTARVNALHYHLMGLAAIRSEFSEANNAQDIALNTTAIQIDPEAPYGYIGIAHGYRNAATFGWNGLDRDEALALATRNAQKAIDIEPDNPGAHYVMARILSETGDFPAAEASYAKAIALDPSASNYMVASTTPLLYTGRTDLAIDRLNEAMGIDPFHPDWYHWQMGWALWEKDDCDGALAAMQRMNKIPKGAHRQLSGIYACLGRIDEARAAYRTFYADAREPTIAEQRAEWQDIWTAPGSLDRWLEHMRLAGMKD